MLTLTTCICYPWNLNIDVPYVYCHLDLVLKNGRRSLREVKHILLRYVQHVPHLRPGKNALQFNHFLNSRTFTAFHSSRGCLLIRFCSSLSSVSNSGPISPLSSTRLRNSISASVNGNNPARKLRQSSTSPLPKRACWILSIPEARRVGISF